MEPKDYVVVKIEGEYAYLREWESADTSKDLFIALALLPSGTDEGTKLHYELFSYTVVD